MIQIKTISLLYLAVIYFFFSASALACGDYSITTSPLQVNETDLEVGAITTTTSYSYDEDCPSITFTPSTLTDDMPTIITLINPSVVSCGGYKPSLSINDNEILITYEKIDMPSSVYCPAIAVTRYHHIALNLPIGNYSVRWFIDDENAPSTLNKSDSSDFTVCPSMEMVKLSSNLDIYIPALEFNNEIVGGELTYNGEFNGQQIWKLKQHGYHSNCGINSLGNIDSNLMMHISSIDLQELQDERNIWVNLEFSHVENNVLYWLLKSYGLND